MKRIRVLHILPTLAMGGAERALAKLVNAPGTIDHEVCVLFPLPRQDRVIAKQIQGAENVPVHCLNMSSYVREWIDARARIRTLIQERDIDVVVTYLTHADLLGRFAARNLNTPVICSLRSTLREPKYLPLTIANGLTLGLVDHVLSVSHACSAVYKQWFGLQEANVTTIPNGIDPAFFSDITSATTRATLSIPENAFVFAYTAVMRPRKGHETLLNAFAKLRKTQSSAYLLLIGDGVLRQALEKQAHDQDISDYITFAGRRSDVPALLRLADAFVFPSTYEGMSNALIEALARELPIIATNIPENIAVTGDDALLVPPNDAPALAAAMTTLIQDKTKREDLQNKSRERAQYFTMEKNADAFARAVTRIYAKDYTPIAPLAKRILSGLHRYPHFFVVNVAGLLINLLCTALFTEVFGLFYLLSYIIGTLTNWTFNFVGNSYLTFKDHDRSGQGRRYLKFLMLYGAVALLNFTTVYILTSLLGLHYLISIILTSGFYSFLTYALLKNAIFKNSR